VEPAVFEFRDRLIEWQQKPGRAKRVFQSDLERWAAEDESSERELLAQQDAWVAQQHHNQFGAPSDSVSAPNPSAPNASGSASPYAKPQQASGSPASSAAGAYESPRLPTASTVIAPAAPLPPTHEPRPTVQQVAAGTGSRGAAQSSGSGSGSVATAEASSLGDLELTTDPGEARAAGEIPPPVNAFPPRKVGSE
jgi:hypothetical protein